jgi:hypothetical protein
MFTFALYQQLAPSETQRPCIILDNSPILANRFARKAGELLRQRMTTEMVNSSALVGGADAIYASRVRLFPILRGWANLVGYKNRARVSHDLKRQGKTRLRA